jgi:hypothetical protein
LSDDAALNVDYDHRRHPFISTSTGPGELYAKQQVAASRAGAKVQTFRAAGAKADAAQAYRAAGARNMSPVPHNKSFMGQPFVEQFPHGSATASAAQDQTSPGGRTATSTRAAAGAAGNDVSAQVAAEADAAIKAVQKTNYIGRENTARALELKHARTIPLYFPPPPSPFTPSRSEPEPPVDPPRDPRYDDPHYLSRGTHPGGGY